MNIPVLIPAYNPDKALISLVEDLQTIGFENIIVVNDGSNLEARPVFDALEKKGVCHVLHHAINLGKGRALKTGFNYFYTMFPNAVGVVTADADCQHTPRDILLVARRLERASDTLVLGSRVFKKNVPQKSRLGNKLTSVIFYYLVGKKLSDTQTGLRGVPTRFVPLFLTLEGERYEYEMNMLIATKTHGIGIAEEAISTIYIDNNKASHFNPVADSMKIYFLLLRFLFSSVFASTIDLAVFTLSYFYTANISASVALARSFAGCINFIVNKKCVFHDRSEMRPALFKYAVLLVLSGLIATLIIETISTRLSTNVIITKIFVETLLFAFNFVVQRDLVFIDTSDARTTDWAEYYNKPYKTASITRLFTKRRLVNYINKCAEGKKNLAIIELGGANSCFFEVIDRSVSPGSYTIVDNNQRGLDIMAERFGQKSNLTLSNENVLNLTEQHPADVVFSIGLIEHFPVEDTQKAIVAHFKAAAENGIIIMSFPTPTFLYRTIRNLSELLGLWIFHDERPLTITEVINTVNQHGEIVDYRIAWELILTQAFVVARKRTGLPSLNNERPIPQVSDFRISTLS